MDFKKAFAGIAATAALASIAVLPASASLTFGTVQSKPTFSAFNYDSTHPGGGVSIVPADANKFTSSSLTPDAQPDTLALTGLANTGFADNGGSGTNWNQALTRGTIHLFDKNSMLLLIGTFTGANMLGNVDGTNPDASVNMTGVVFTGGAYWTEALIEGFGPPSALTFTLISTAPLAITNNAGNNSFNSFVGGGTGTFSASFTPPPGVPEPASFLPFTLGALGLIALIIRSRKSARFGGFAA